MPLDIAQGEASKEDAIARALAGAKQWWLDQAYARVVAIAVQRAEFTTDPIWEWLERDGVPSPREPRALGPVMRRAAANGIIEDTGRVQKSAWPPNHRRKQTVWRSLIHGHSEQ